MSNFSYAEILHISMVKESIGETDRKIALLTDTIETILRFPSKISYDAMVPLSKVGFAPGRILHTNEFQVQDEHSGERKWLSHVEAADHLKDKIVSLKRQRANLMQQLTSLGDDPNYAPLSNSLNIEDYENNDMEGIEDMEDIEEVHSTGRIADAKEEEEDVLNSDPFEIREFYDDSGKEVKSEVVSLSKAFDSATQNAPKDNDKLNKIYEDIASKLNVDAPVPVEVDEQSAFVRELATASAGSVRPLEVDDWEYLNRLEAEEEQSDHRAKQLKIDKQSFTADAGWKKGFLSQKQPAKKANVPVPSAAESAAILAHNTAMNSKSSIRATATKPVISHAPMTAAPPISGNEYAEKPVSRFKAARAQQSGKMLKMTTSASGGSSSEAFNKAFTGQIKEK